MKVGFLNNQIDNRGTGNAIFDYADYNEKILGNESFVFTFAGAPVDEKMWDRLKERFGGTRTGFLGGENNWFPSDLDVLYHIKSGSDDGFRAPEGVRYVVHGVFERPSGGDRNAVVSHWLSSLYDVPYVPHIISLPNDTETLRSSLGINKDAIVFGRYGGIDTFDIHWVWDAIGSTLDRRNDVVFLFVNTGGIPHEIMNSNRVLSAPQIGDPREKRRFINTCDAMIHARNRGETFGIAVGEFARYGKPIITYGGSYEQNHYLELPYAEKYNDKEELVDILLNFKPYTMKGYMDYSPEKVMKKFKEVFLD